ncbi:MAG TPA: DmsE family decaheme c-type cytochrome [Terracidiphilus sp.]|nr:DmsE family decaheme c-type cytochrome [Terracidiphilus sp.]
MHRNKPVAQLLGAAIPVRTPGLQVIFMLLLGAAIFSATAIAAPAKGDKQAAEPAASDFVGSDTCATCHQDVAKGFAGNPHNKIAEMHGKAGISCEGCHGPGKAHVEGGGDVSKIFDPAKASPKQVDEKCLSCHGGAHPNFMRSPHAKGGVSCISCHSIHAAKTPEHLLTAAQPELCFQCHNDVKPQFSMPFHHPVNEGLVKCGDCHDVHGTFGNNNLKSTADQNAVCTKCHAETRGPFVYEHAPVKAEGCLACHSPHGSQNARMLNAPSVNTLCNQCHSPVASHTVTGMGQGSAELAPCTSCHTYIHGSNLNQAFLR